MRFCPTTLRDAYIIQPEPAHDNRGFFSRTFCADAFAERGLEVHYPQHSVSFSARKGTLRGLHFQREPHAEAKLIRCVRGAFLDVIVDIRPDSSTYRQWQKFELSSANCRQLYIPRGFAHGFQTLCDDVEVSYLISTRYRPEFADGVRYDDPAFAIDWPLPITAISEKDLHWSRFSK